MLEPILPIILYLFLGYLFKLIYQDNSKQLIEFVINFSLPAIVFYKVYPLVLEQKILYLILMFIGFILFNLLLAYFIGKLMKLNKVSLATFMIMATFGNTSFKIFTKLYFSSKSFPIQYFILFICKFSFHNSRKLICQLLYFFITYFNT